MRYYKYIIIVLIIELLYLMKFIVKVRKNMKLDYKFEKYIYKWVDFKLKESILYK